MEVRGGNGTGDHYRRMQLLKQDMIGSEETFNIEINVKYTRKINVIYSIVLPPLRHLKMVTSVDIATRFRLLLREPTFTGEVGMPNAEKALKNGRADLSSP